MVVILNAFSSEYIMHDPSKLFCRIFECRMPGPIAMSRMSEANIFRISNFRTMQKSVFDCLF